jgi:hypothetical protein
MLDNAPETLQYLMGIHPLQVAQANALAQAAQGNSGQLQQGQQADDQAPVATPSPYRHEPLPLKTDGDDTSPAPASSTDEATHPAQSPVVATARGPRAIKPRSGEAESFIGPQMPEEDPQVSPAALGGPNPLPESAYSPSNTPRPISQDMATMQGLRDHEAADRSEVDRLRDTGSGVDQFMHRHRFLGPLVKGLTVAGEVVAPHVAALIPGTDLHHNVLVDQARTRVEQDQGDQRAHQQLADMQAADDYKQETARIRALGTGEKFVAGREKEDPNSPTGWISQTFDGEWKPYTPPQSYKNTKAEDRAQIMRQREEDVKRLGLTGDEAKYYRANGKLKEPGTNIHVPSAAAEAFHDWKAAFQRDNGRAPNAQEISDYQHGNKRPPQTKDRASFELHWSKQLGPGSAVERKYDTQRQNVLKSYGADKDTGKYKDNKAEIDAKFAEIEANRESEKSRLQQEKDAEAEQYGIYSQPAQPQGAPPAKGAPPAARTTQKPAPSPGDDVGGGYTRNQQIMVDGKPMVVTGYNSQTGKPKVRPAGM